MPDEISAKKEVKTPLSSKKLASIASCVLWIVGFALGFVIPGSSPFVWVSDALLLIGFFPVMYIYPAGWTWFIFGLLNACIGFILEVGYHLPDNVFIGQLSQGLVLRDALKSTHPSIVWILLGAVCVIFGSFRIARTIIRFIRKRMQK